MQVFSLYMASCEENFVFVQVVLFTRVKYRVCCVKSITHLNQFEKRELTEPYLSTCIVASDSTLCYCLTVRRL